MKNLKRRSLFLALIMLILAPVKSAFAACFLRPIVNVSFDKAFADVGTTSKMTILLINPDLNPATLIRPFTNTLPLLMTTSGTASSTCIGGTTTNSVTSVTLTGAMIPGNGSCTITVNVTSAVGGTYTNLIPACSLETNHCDNAVEAAATLNFTTPSISTPTVTKSFSPISTAVTVPSQLTITLSNSTATAVTGVSFTDNLPLGLQMLSLDSSSTCISTTGNVSFSESTITLTNGTIPANASCNVIVNVSPRFADNFINTFQSGAISSPAGTNDNSAATLTALGPAVSQAFSPNIIDANNSTLTITLLNPTTTPAVLIAPFVNILPEGLFVCGSATTTCGGMLFAEGRVIKLIGGGIPAGAPDPKGDIQGSSCTISVQVNSNNYGSFTNEICVNALRTSIGPNAFPSFAKLRSMPLEG